MYLFTDLAGPLEKAILILSFPLRNFTFSFDMIFSVDFYTQSLLGFFFFLIYRSQSYHRGENSVHVLCNTQKNKFFFK